MTPTEQAIERVGGQPIAWALYNPATGKVDHRCYQREDVARVGAVTLSNRWRTLIAVPLFLHATDPVSRATGGAG